MNGEKNKLATLQDRLDNALKDDHTALKQLEKSLPLSDAAKKKMNTLENFKKDLLIGKRPLTIAEIECYFLKWSVLDNTKKNFVNIYELQNHFIKKEKEINNNDISSIALISNAMSYSSIIGRILKKYNVRYKSFKTGRTNYTPHDGGTYRDIKEKKYALILK